MAEISALSLWCAGAAMLGATVVHVLYRVAEALERRGRLPSRDYVMVPGLGVVVAVLAWAADWLGEHRADLLGGVGFAVLLGMRIGQMMPRPPRRRRS